MNLLKETQFLHTKLPFQVVLYPTSRCNARCFHCYNSERQSRTAKRDELTIDEIGRISSQLGHVKVLTISGGEPFLRDDLAEIVSLFHRNNGLQYVSFHTNGFLGEKVASTVRRVASSFPDLTVIVCLSVDGIGELHDRIRGVPGGFQKLLGTLAGLKEIKNRYGNLFLVATTIYSRSTQGSFQDTMRYVRDEMGIKPSLSFIRGSVSLPQEKEVHVAGYQSYQEREGQRRDDTVPAFSPMALKETLESLVSGVVVQNYLKNEQTVACQAGRRLVVIYENGDVYPCETAKDAYGNLREAGYNLSGLLFSERGRAITRRISAERACSCTWENIVPVNLLFSVKHYPKILRAWWRLFHPLRKRGARTS